MKRRAHHFSARVVKRSAFGFYAVLIPASVSRALGVRGAIPIVGIINEKIAFRSSLMPRAVGLHLLFLNGDVRSRAKIALGDRVTVAFDVDRQSRDVATPEDLRDALDDEGLLGAYATIPRGRKNQFLRWLDQAVHESTRAKRIAHILEMAHAAREKQADREV